MSALVKALDNSTPIQSGEKGNTEYAWSNSIQERILQLSFQTTRTDSAGIEKLADVLRSILRELQYGHKIGNQIVEHLTATYKMIGHTRDIIDGKGEYTLAYSMLLVWYEFYPELALFALEKFVKFDDNNTHPYGSWKDIKYFCNYCKSKGLLVNHPLLVTSFQLINTQIRQDAETTSDSAKTLAGKWAPREKCVRFGWIFEQLACLYFPQYLQTAMCHASIKKAKNKCKMEFRKICNKLNKELETTQIFQCANQWANIDHSKTTSITIYKQKKAFLNLNKDGTQRTCLEDRIQCAANFQYRIKKAVAGECEIKGKRIGLNNFTVQARELIKEKCKYGSYNIPEGIQIQMDLLNSQWRDNATQTDALTKMIAMCDFSGSMEGEPLDACIALGIRVAEKSVLGNRVLSFSDNPKWHNLDGCNTFIEKVEILHNGEVGFSTQFYKALTTILDVIVQNKLKPEDVSDMVLAVFSDMQIDQANGPNKKENMDTLYNTISKMYADTGIKLYGIPFVPPHILFWNLRSTSGFPALSSQKNVSMMSGFSPALLNLFCEKGIEAFANCTPWSILIESINNPRYKCLEDKVRELIL